MTVSFSLLVGTLIVTSLAPMLLRRMQASRVDPTFALVAWLVFVLCFVTSLVLAVGLLLVPGHGPAHALMLGLHHCWTHVRPGELPWFVTVPASIFTVAMVCVGVRVLLAVRKQHRARRSVHRRHMETLRIVATPEAGPYPTMWLDHTTPIAYSVAGRPAVVVATKGLYKSLPGDAVAAVIAHEHAHIRGHHHLLVGLAEAIASALPLVPFARRSPDFVRFMVELAADRSAARRHGVASVRSALRVMSTLPIPHAALGMAQEAVAVRLAWLNDAQADSSTTGRRLRAGLTGFITAASSFSVSVGVLVVVAVAACPFLTPH